MHTRIILTGGLWYLRMDQHGKGTTYNLHMQLESKLGQTAIAGRQQGVKAKTPWERHVSHARQRLLHDGYIRRITASCTVKPGP